MSSALENFLTRNSVVPSKALPLIHTTKSYNIEDILDRKQIATQKCDVFIKDKLNYFFVGRPAYKYKNSTQRAEAWELPCCFIFEANVVKKPKRVFPFDSGAFAGGLYPDYISLMPQEKFLLNVSDGPQRIIGSFFGTTERYFGLKAKGREEFEKEFSLTVTDAEISAVMKLAHEATIDSFDDRRLTIEVQSVDDVDLGLTRPLAVVLPEIYLDNKKILNIIQNDLKAEPLGYPMFPLSVAAYYALIYAEVLSFYKREKLL